MKDTVEDNQIFSMKNVENCIMFIVKPRCKADLLTQGLCAINEFKSRKFENIEIWRWRGFTSWKIYKITEESADWK